MSIGHSVGWRVRRGGPFLFSVIIRPGILSVVFARGCPDTLCTGRNPGDNLWRTPVVRNYHNRRGNQPRPRPRPWSYRPKSSLHTLHRMLGSVAVVMASVPSRKKEWFYIMRCLPGRPALPPVCLSLSLCRRRYDASFVRTLIVCRPVARGRHARGRVQCRHNSPLQTAA